MADCAATVEDSLGRMLPQSTPTVAALLLAWYDANRRALPWRAPPGGRADPHAVWLSEIMLQQTTVATVRPLFERFLARFPDTATLAAAPQDAVLAAWAGLGYYARARNLHACAQAVMAQHGGRLPAEEAALRRLPGIGDYTAAAIAAIAFDRPATPVDGNVIRVVARLAAIEAPLPGAKAAIAAAAAQFTPRARPGDFAQAMMDLGATICTPRRPACDRCPLAAGCKARAASTAERLPRRAPRPVRPTRHALAFLAERADGAILLTRRAPRGLLGGMMELPSTAWRDAPWTLEEALPARPCPGTWRRLAGEVRHVFTHLTVQFAVAHARVAGDAPGTWATPEALDSLALPTLARKLIRHGQSALDARQ